MAGQVFRRAVDVGVEVEGRVRRCFEARLMHLLGFAFVWPQPMQAKSFY
jgi:hypothetical protein